MPLFGNRADRLQKRLVILSKLCIIFYEECFSARCVRKSVLWMRRREGRESKTKEEQLEMKKTVALLLVLAMVFGLDNGKFQGPRNETEARLLTEQQTRWLLEGLKIEQPKAIREGKPGILY